MKESVLIRIVGGLLLMTFLLFSGCGSGSDPIIKSSKDSNTTKQQEEARKKAAIDAANKKIAEEKAKKEAEEAEALKKAEEEAAKKKRYSGYVKNIGNISGIQVRAFDDKGHLVGTTTTDKDGKYTFELSNPPSYIQLVDSGLETLNDYASYITKCTNEKQKFQSDVAIECQPMSIYTGSDLNATQAKFFRTYLAHAYDSMGILDKNYNPKIIEAIKDAEDIDGIVKLLNKITGLNTVQKSIIENVARIVSGVNTDTSTTAMLALDIVLKLDNNSKLKNGDGGVTEWLKLNKTVLEDYIKENPNSDIQTLALRLTQQIQKGELSGTTDLADLKSKIKPEDVAKCDVATSEVCFPRPELFIFKGSYDKSGVDINNILTITTVFEKTKNLSEFKIFDDYIEFKKSNLNYKSNQFDKISNNKNNLFNIHFMPDVNKTDMAGKKLLAVSIFEFFEDNDESKASEYLTIAFPMDANVSSDNNLTFFVPADSDIFFFSKIKEGTKYEKTAVKLENSNKKAFDSDRGHIVFDPMKYFNDIFNRINDKTKKERIKKFIVTKTSNVGGVPGLFIKNLALIDISSSPWKNFIKNPIKLNSLNFGLSNPINPFKELPSSLDVVRIKSYFKD